MKLPFFLVSPFLFLLPLCAADKRPATNAALPKYGTVIEVVPDTGAHSDRSAKPAMLVDGNAHSRYVLTGVPYTIVIELPSRIPVSGVALSQSDYQSEQAAKEIEIQVDGQAPARYTLELKRPEKKGAPAWQELPVAGEGKEIRIRVLSNYVPDEGVRWGGIAEVAVLTPADLEAGLEVPGGGFGRAPVFANIPAAAEPRTAPDVHLPEVAKPGEHPCLLLTKQELAALVADLNKTERGKETRAQFLKIADGILARRVEFPDPNGPQAQMKDRNDAVAKQHAELSSNAGTLGMAFAITGDAKYAGAAAEILSGYAQRYNAYPEHKGVNKSDTGKVMAQRLSEAMWLVPLIEAYDYIFESGCLSEAGKTEINDRLIRPAIAFIWRKEPAQEAAERDRQEPGWRAAAPKPAPGKFAPNWLNYYNAATIMAGAVLGDRDMVDLAVANLRAQLSYGIGADGMWNEGAIGYQLFSLAALTPALEVAARQGVDLWSFDRGRLKMLFDSPLRYSYPDGTAPGINDSGRAPLGNWSAMVYDYAYLRYRDSAYAALINAAPRQLHFSQGVFFPTRIYETLADPPRNAERSAVFENLGYAILRNERIYALLDYGPHGGVHGHFDKLNLVLFGAVEGRKGDELGGEPVFHRYEDSIHSEWTVHTVAHNTMTVDGRSQLECAGRLLLFEDTPEIKIMRAEAEAYPGALLDRTVVVLPDLVIDLFHGASARTRAWDRTLRYQGTLDRLTATAVKPSAALGTRDGFQHLKVVSEEPGAEMWRGRWNTAVGGLDVVLAGVLGQEIVLALGPDRDHVAMARQEAKTADFATALSLDGWNNPVRKAGFVATGQPGIVAFEVVQSDGSVTKIVVRHDAAEAGTEWTVFGWRSDARALCLREKGGQAQLLVAGGKHAQASHVSWGVAQQAPGNYLASGPAKE